MSSNAALAALVARATRTAYPLAGAVFLSCRSSTGSNFVDCASLPVAPESVRVDLSPPSFSNPLSITNTLFPISNLASAVLLGTVDGLPFRAETTLLPGTKTIAIGGRSVLVAESQYVAFLDGQLHEVALDWYAQADDGSVWYLGEDVFNYESGEVADQDGTWMAGRDGPAAMIMPASPRPGNVYRPENICGLVFEEVTVKTVGVSVTGPTGAVAGAVIVEELHMDGSREEKTFAPGYGEFFTGSGGDVEAMALAVPTDALAGGPPTALTTLTDGAMSVFDAAASGSWSAAGTSLAGMNAAWNSWRAGTPPPPLLAAQMTTALGRLASAVNARNVNAARLAALETARASLDFLLRYRSPTEVDRARFDTWAAQAMVDAAAGVASRVSGDVSTLEWIIDRFGHTLPPALLSQVNGFLAQMRAAADARSLSVVASAAAQLRAALAAGTSGQLQDILSR